MLGTMPSGTYNLPHVCKSLLKIKSPFFFLFYFTGERRNTDIVLVIHLYTDETHVVLNYSINKHCQSTSQLQ